MLAVKAWFEQQLARVSAKSVIAEAIRYALHHWDGLTRFLDDGRIELDNNVVERGIRPIVLNRKDALLADHDQGAENWACIASLIETCKLHGVDPQAYLVVARRASRRTHALGLGRPALHPQPRGVTHRIAPQPQLKNQAVRSVQSKDRLP